MNREKVKLVFDLREIKLKFPQVYEIIHKENLDSNNETLTEKRLKKKINKKGIYVNFNKCNNIYSFNIRFTDQNNFPYNISGFLETLDYNIKQFIYFKMFYYWQNSINPLEPFYNFSVIEEQEKRLKKLRESY